ncbi:MAG: hypothetical protein U1F43_38775 [Myxococcota bacterium]
MKQWDAWWKQLRQVAQKAAAAPDTLNVAYAGANLAKRLHLDNLGRIDLTEKAMRLVDKQAENDRKVALRKGLAEEMLKAGLTDRAAKILTEIRQYTQDASALDEVADWLEMGRDLHAELEKSDALAPWRKEFFLLNYTWPPTSPLKEAQAVFTGSSLSDKARQKLNHLRQWSATYPGEDYHWVGDTLVWPLAESRADVLSGPSSDRLRAQSFRYFWNNNGVAAEAFFYAAFGETPTRAPSLALSLDYQRAVDWYASMADKVASDVRPKVTLLFAMRDVTGKGPGFDAYGVRLDGEKAELVHVARANGKRVLQVDVIASAKLGLSGGKNDVKLTVGKDVTVTVGSKSQRFDLKMAAGAPANDGFDGFPGVLVEGAGYVDVGALTVTQ